MTFTGFKYYVYVRPSEIYYFYNYDEALKVANFYGINVSLINK